jgi:hypothetical protein
MKASAAAGVRASAATGSAGGVTSLAAATGVVSCTAGVVVQPASASAVSETDTANRFKAGLLSLEY